MGFFGDLLDIIGIGDGGRGARAAEQEAAAAKKRAEDERKKAEEQAAQLAKQQADYQQAMQNMAANAKVDLGNNENSSVLAGGSAELADTFTKKKKTLSAPVGVATQLGINI